MFCCRISHSEVPIFAKFSKLWPLVIYSKRKVIFKGDCFFPQVICSFSQELKCSGARNKFRTVALPTMLIYLTENLNLTGYLTTIYLRTSLLRIKKNVIILSGSSKYRKWTPQYTRKLGKFLSEYLSLQSWVCPFD